VVVKYSYTLVLNFLTQNFRPGFLSQKTLILKTFLKICLLDPSSPKMMIMLAIVPNMKESHYNLSQLWSATDLGQISYSFHGDHKIILPAIGMFEYRLSFLNNNLSIYL
jgi:hypothetical protein